MWFDLFSACVCVPHRTEQIILYFLHVKQIVFLSAAKKREEHNKSARCIQEGKVAGNVAAFE